MSRFFLFLIFLAAGFAAGFGAARWKAIELLVDKSSALKKNTTLDFLPTLYPLDNRSFCIVIIGRNNGAYLERTLQSVFSQKYEHFRIVYVDDGSDDGSFDLAKELVYASPFLNQVRLLQNDKQLGHVASLSAIVHGCPDEEIVLVLHGEDWLAHEWVLQRLNQYYADPDLWLTYGQALDYPTFQPSFQGPLLSNIAEIRSFHTEFHPYSFYAGLFKKINEFDFLYKGEFLPVATDLAYMLPLLEMAQGHSQALPDVLYVTNRESHKEDDLEKQVFFENYIRSLKPYEKLLSLEFKRDFEALE